MPLSETSGTLPPAVQAEIEAVARELDRFGLQRNATRLRALLGELPNDEEPYPVQDGARQVAAIPTGLAKILWPAYGDGYGQSFERMAERGGFGRSELGSLAADCYVSGQRPRPRLSRMPLLDLYDMARRAS